MTATITPTRQIKCFYALVLPPSGTPQLINQISGRKDISMKYAAILSAEGVGCILFFFMQLGKEFLYGELEFLIMMGTPAIVASLLAYAFFSRCVCCKCIKNYLENKKKEKTVEQ